MIPSSPKTALSTLIRLSPLVALCSWSRPASAQNLITNGTFDGTEIGPWWDHADTNKSAAQTVEVVDGRMCSTVAEGAQGENPWDVILGYSGVPLVKDQYYHVKLTASATIDREIRVKTGLGDAPYTDYILQKFKVTAVPQTFEFTYLNLRENPEAQVQLHIGDYPGQLCLDDISVEQVPAPAAPAYVSPSTTGYPLKAHSAMVKMGTAVDTPIFLTNPLHNAIVAAEFSAITPANSMKMNNIQPTRGGFEWTDTDALYAWANANSLEFRGHPLIWHTQAPGWLNDDMTLTREPMIEIMNAHIDTVIARYPNLPYWDVVNEAIDQNKTTGEWTFRSTIWHDRIGPDFIDLAFQRARNAAPAAKLLYNDYNIEQMGNAKADRVFLLVKDLKEKGLLDAVGLQSHYYVTSGGGPEGIPNIKAIEDNMARYAEIGVEVHITECDFRIGKPIDAAKDEIQKKFYADLLQACVDAPNCSHFTVWGLSDLDSWVPSTFPEMDYAHIFNSEFVAKSSYHAMTQVFAAYNLDGTPKNAGGGAGGGAGCSFEPARLGERAPWRLAVAGAFGFAIWLRRRSGARA